MVIEVDFNDLPAVREVRVYQGDTYRQPYEILLNDEPLDLTGASIRVAIRRRPGRGEVVVQRDIVPEDPALGQFTVVVPAEDTARMLGSYFYEVVIDWPAGSAAFSDGCTKTILAGPFVVSDDVLD